MEGMHLKYFAEVGIEKVLPETFRNKGIVLSEFLTQRVLQYEEPQRKGRRKGSKIGFGKKKIWTVFLAAIGYNPKPVYILLAPWGMSYGSIRDWFVEPEFKKLVLQFQDEITTGFVTQFIKLAETTDTTFLDADKEDLWKIFGRAENYGRELTKKILSEIVNHLNESRSLLLFQTACMVISALFESFPPSHEFKKLDRLLENDLDFFTLAHIYHKLKSNEGILGPSLTQRKRLLNMMKKHIYQIGIESKFVDLDHIEKFVTDGSWVSDDPRFPGKVDLVFDGQAVGTRRGRPRKKKIA